MLVSWRLFLFVFNGVSDCLQIVEDLTFLLDRWLLLGAFTWDRRHYLANVISLSWRRSYETDSSLETVWSSGRWCITLACFFHLFNSLYEHLFNLVWRHHVFEVIEIPIESVRWKVPLAIVLYSHSDIIKIIQIQWRGAFICISSFWFNRMFCNDIFLGSCEIRWCFCHFCCLWWFFA